MHLDNHNRKENSYDVKFLPFIYLLMFRKHTRKSSGSSAGGGGSYLPTRKFSIPVQATITPIQLKNQSIKI